MSMNAGLRTFVLNDATVAGLVGARMYRAGVVPAGAPSPYLVFQRISEPSSHTHSAADTRTRSTWQIDAYGTYDPNTEAGAAMFDTVEALDDAVRDRLDGYTGPLGSHTDCYAMHENSIDLPEMTEDGSDRVEVRTMQQYAIWRNR